MSTKPLIGAASLNKNCRGLISNLCLFYRFLGLQIDQNCKLSLDDCSNKARHMVSGKNRIFPFEIQEKKLYGPICGTIQDHRRPYGAIRDHIGPYQTIWDHTGSNGVIREHMGT